MQLLGAELKQLGLISLSARRGGRSHWLPLQDKPKEITAKRDPGQQSFYLSLCLEVASGGVWELYSTTAVPNETHTFLLLRA